MSLKFFLRGISGKGIVTVIGFFTFLRLGSMVTMGDMGRLEEFTCRICIPTLTFLDTAFGTNIALTDGSTELWATPP